MWDTNTFQQKMGLDVCNCNPMLCLFKEFKPSAPFLMNSKNFSETEVTSEIYPYSTYSYLVAALAICIPLYWPPLQASDSYQNILLPDQSHSTHLGQYIDFCAVCTGCLWCCWSSWSLWASIWRRRHFHANTNLQTTWLGRISNCHINHSFTKRMRPLRN